MGQDGRHTSPVRLNQAALMHLPRSVLVPNYDRAQLSPGIIHIGVGNFHRAHQAWHLHRLMQAGKAHDWAIIGAGVRSYDADMRTRLLAQDCLTTLIELDPSGTSAEVVGAQIDYLPIQEDNAALIAQMADPRIRIVSLTVTEGGYFLDPVTGGFDAAHPDIRHDAQHPNQPRTAFGAMIAALRIRKDAGIGPFTAQSCDNLVGNGGVLRQTLVSLAALSDPDLASWIDEKCSFPNSMVDCIVPATGPKEIELAHEMGIDDAAPVTHENFRQWVIEDNFCAGRPPWEDVGATIARDVHPYEAMKIRILNAGHQVLANVGEVLSISTIADCMQDDLIAAFFRKVQTEDILPYVAPVPGMTPLAYLDLIERRFANPTILDTTRRVAFDGSSRHTSFVLPILRDALAADGSVQGLALVEALWARMCAGEREDGSKIDANDPHWGTLQAAGQAARIQPEVWLDQSQLYGDLPQATEFAISFNGWLQSLWANGSRETLRQYLSQSA